MTNPTIKSEIHVAATKPAADYEIVLDLLKRQEAVLQELDQLNDRVEATIQAITAVRQAEIAAEGDNKNLADLPAKRAA